MTNETEEQMQVWCLFTRVSTFIPTQTYMHIACVPWIAGYCVVFLAAACGKVATAFWGVAGWTGLVL